MSTWTEATLTVSTHRLSRLFLRLALVIAMVVGAVHAGLWLWMQDQRTAADFYGKLPSLSYTAFEGKKRERGDGYAPTVEQLRADMRALAPVTRAVRTYTSTEGSDLVPGAAAEFGLKVTVGAWLDSNPERNSRELESVIALARTHANVNGIYVGNELNVRADVPLLRGETLTETEKAALASKEKKAIERVTVDRLIKVIREVRAATGGRVPLSTGEIYNVWLDYPELANAVDFIAIHVLPYWEGTDATRAVDSTIEIYNKVKAAYPNKHIVISEFGWPSAGYNRHGAVPGRLEQAQIIRDFAVRAEALNIDYNVIEAYDQPWKTFEGGVGPYWGALNTAREMKFDWTGPIVDKSHRMAGTVAVVLGFLLAMALMIRQGLTPARLTLGQGIVLAVAGNVVGAWIAWVMRYWTDHYLVVGATIAYLVGLVLLVPLMLVALNLVTETAQFWLGRSPRRLLTPGKLAQTGTMPKVSIHIPACREPAEMLKETLNSVAALNYPDFECVVLVNNTPDPAMWMPVEEHCRQLGSRFKFVNAGKIAGFKACALNIALEHTAPEAEIIGVIDADYVLDPDWLKDLVPAFSDPGVGLVQAPQDHRDADRSVMHRAMNNEYAGFFDIGMVSRNEANAIITHGTMCLVRRKAIAEAGGWSDDTICEDTDLGLTILEKGWRQHYTNRRYGHGLLPNTFRDYKKQRHRWASGGMQIVHKHWRALFSRDNELTAQQRGVFAAGWLSWMGNEAVGVLIALLNIVWTPVVVFASIAVPDKILTLPILIMLGVSFLHFAMLYRRCVGMAPKDMALALVGHMSLQWTIAKAVGSSLKMRHLVFNRTDKGGKAQAKDAFPAREEAVIGSLLLGSALLVHMTNYTQIRELSLFALVMVVQSLPFVFAVVLALMERLPQTGLVPAVVGEAVPAETQNLPVILGVWPAPIQVGPAPIVSSANEAEPVRKSG